jgi:hypothetical protein
MLDIGSSYSSKASDTYMQRQQFKRDNISIGSVEIEPSLESSERVKVYVRVRPAFPKEIRQDETALSFKSPRSDQIPEVLSSRGSED